MKAFLLALCLLAAPAWAAKPLIAHIPAMTCEDCAEAITDGLKANPAVDSVAVDVKAKTATITLKDDASLSDGEIKQAVEKAGFVLAGVDR